MTSVTTCDKSDEALVKVVRFCRSLKPLDINLCRGRWTATSEGGEGGGEKRGRQRAATVQT